MKFQDKLKTSSKQQLWDEYCGFLDVSLDDYMYIQRRLMEEQLRVWKASGLGRSLLDGLDPCTVEDFRSALPLTDYSDYADILLSRKADMLPAEPLVWIQTTWEGGLRPIKLAPYTREMLDAYQKNAMAVTMLSSSRGRGDFSVRRGDRMLYGGAPLPFATGILPYLLNENIDLDWLPDDNVSSGLSFSERIKTGFSMAMSGGVDFFFAIGSVANYITENFSRSIGGGGGHHRGAVSAAVACRYVRGRYLAKRDGRSVVPADIFRLKGLVCTGTDAAVYRAALTRAWGVEPIELCAGTESTCIGTETWEHNGMVFFPNSCFYEFIPESEMLRSLAEPDYQPRTCLMDAVRVGERYELVISVLHGGAFMRYRIGDVFRCVSAERGRVPRFTFVDRVPNVIDIAGFTRLTEASIGEVIRLSKLGIGEWLARKEFGDAGVPYLHMYIEITPEAQVSDALGKRVLADHLSAYFRYFDSDYNDLKKLLGIEPLQITILKHGTIDAFRRTSGRPLCRISPSAMDVAELMRFHVGSPRPRTGGDRA